MEPGKNIINWDNVFKQSQSFKNNEPFMFGFVEEFIQQEFYEKLFETYPKLDDMLDYFVDNTYDDLFTVDSKGTRNGSIRITKSQYVKDGTMSRRVGSMLDDCTNIHSEEDLKQAERNIQNNE